MKERRVLIFDVSSVVGSSLAIFLKRYYRVFGLSYANESNIEGIVNIPINPLDKEEVLHYLTVINPDIVIFNVKNSLLPVSKDKYDDKWLYEVSLENLRDIVEKLGAKIIFISSFFVFRGEDKVYHENDFPNALSSLGKILSRAEFFIQKNFSKSLIIRPCYLYSRGLNFLSSFMDILEYALANDQPIVIDDKILTGFLDVDYLNMVVHLAIKMNLQNKIIHLSSKDVMSFYQFGSNYAQLFFHKSSILQGRWNFPYASNIIASLEASVVSYQFKLFLDYSEEMLSISFPTVEESLQYTFDKYKGRTKIVG